MISFSLAKKKKVVEKGVNDMRRTSNGVSFACARLKLIISRQNLCVMPSTKMK